MFPTIVVSGLCLVVLATIVASISRHKKSATGEIRLIGATALVDSELNPVGTVLVRGELWQAQCSMGTCIAVHSRVKVVALQGHLLIVEPHDCFTSPPEKSRRISRYH